MVAQARIEIEMARLLTMRTAWLMDRVGNRAARAEIHIGGVSDDFPLASTWAHLRTLRLADGTRRSAPADDRQAGASQLRGSDCD